MYFPISSPSVVQEDYGVWAPIDHQRVISLLTIGLGVMYHREKTITLEPLPETMLDEGKASLVPDVSLRDNQTDQTPIIIEVCHTNGLKADLRKVIQLIDDDLYGIREGFVYNYKTTEWLRYRFGDGGLTSASSYSIILGLDLASLL
ncbi:hypothetical protein FAES_5172 [Fibrella aestuarina BUZ 2]|uniref:Restriction endonuclease domain-containing protein n=1 Tax=Fibrella aestuarina BUZ 2 TaxID=1166018 RepID=I0KGB8_9BACT|nr:hypothetical protein [Fibrella aestuarina]CCH03171.1 hypothetical protein FAES_5172 [Fibrella aestuarina BUZ 2]